MQIIWNDNMLQTTVIVSVFIIMLVMFRRFIFRFSVKRVGVFVWAIVLIRLILPIRIQIELPFSVLGERWQQLCEWFHDIFFQPAVLLIWGAGVLIVLAGFLFSYAKCKQTLGESLPITRLPSVDEDLFTFMGIDVYISDRITSPITYGVLRQKILIPKIFMDLPREQLKYVLIHEKIHIDRHDNLRKFFMIAALCLYWFHPLVWLMYNLYNRDLEISCDEKVLRRVGKEHREGYAMALIYLAEHGTTKTTVYSGFGQNAIKKRIFYVMKYRKNPVLAIIGAILFTIPLLLSFVDISVKKESPIAQTTSRYAHVAKVETILGEDPYKNSVNILAKNNQDIAICFRIWKDRGYAEVHGKSFSDNKGNSDDWQSGISKEVKGILKVPDAVNFEGVQYPVEILGDYSFYKCNQLTEISLPETIKKTRKDVFYGCSELTSLELPAGMEEIDGNPFRKCSSLKQILIAESKEKGNYVTRDGVLYSDFGRYIKAYPPGRRNHVYQIPNDVTRIAKRACEGALFSEVIIPDGVYLIHEKAFWDCKNLDECQVPKNARVAEDSFEQIVSIHSN